MTLRDHGSLVLFSGFDHNKVAGENLRFGIRYHTYPAELHEKQ